MHTIYTVFEIYSAILLCKYSAVLCVQCSVMLLWKHSAVLSVYNVQWCCSTKCCTFIAQCSVMFLCQHSAVLSLYNVL